MRSFSLPTLKHYIDCHGLNTYEWQSKRILLRSSCVVCSFLLLKRNSVSLNSEYFMFFFHSSSIFFSRALVCISYKRARQKCSKSLINYLQSVHLKVCIYGEEAKRTDNVRHRKRRTDCMIWLKWTMNNSCFSWNEVRH